MKLDIVIPTFNRSLLLRKALASIARAPVPADISVTIIVADNNSSDDTAAATRQFAEQCPMPVQYVFERRQGRSQALNAAIETSSADLIGMIDDDEEIAEDWVETVGRCFRNRPELGFIGGPYRGNWSQEPPGWLPAEFPAVIGVLDGGDAVVPYGGDFPAILPGGNAVVRRHWLTLAGPYNPAVGRSGNRLLGGEDVDMFRRLQALGAHGEYRPDLVIYHHIPAERLTRRYFREWAWSHGVSLGTLNRNESTMVPRIAGIPRYLVRQSLESVGRLTLLPFRRLTLPASAFADELRVRQFMGFVAGHWLKRE